MLQKTCCVRNKMSLSVHARVALLPQRGYLSVSIAVS